jgi:undecaprenyl-diphosphatase
MVLEFDPDELGANLGEGLALFGVGAAVAAVTGYICLVLLTRLLEDARFHHFAWYCWIVGAVGLWFFGR